MIQVLAEGRPLPAETARDSGVKVILCTDWNAHS
jgi:hypothetical protein